MSYLRRRIEKLLSDLESGKLTLAEHLRPEIASYVARVQRDEAGQIDLGSCDPMLKSLARMSYAAQAAAQPPPASTATVLPIADVTAYNRELFEHFETVFHAFFGMSVEEFSRKGDFDETVRDLGASYETNRSLAAERHRAGHAALSALRTFYSNCQGFDLAASLPGNKLVLGGAQHFSGSSQSAVRRLALYSDTTLVPDPVLPWLEIDRSQDQFPTIRMLESIYYLLPLKEVALAEGPSPALFVFPSWEKTLEETNPDTQDGIEQLALRFFSHYLHERFEDLSEVFDFARRRADDFLRAVQAASLFIPLSGGKMDSISAALQVHRAHLETWRTANFMEKISGITDAELVVLSILERLGPQFHLRENAESFSASPLCSIEVQWHYFRLLSEAGGQALEATGAVKPETLAVAYSLASPDLRWLGNVPIDALVQIRNRAEYQQLRQDLGAQLEGLRCSGTNDLDRAIPEVALGIRSLLKRHQNDIEKTLKEFQGRYTQTAIASWMTLAASLLPVFPVPLAPSAALLAAAKYMTDKASEKRARSEAGRTMMGFLSSAYREGPPGPLP